MPRRNLRRKGRALNKAAGLIEDGLRCYEGGDKQGAEEKLRAACASVPSVPQTHYNLGYFYSLEERWHEAEKALRKAIEHQPDYHAHYLRSPACTWNWVDWTARRNIF